MSSARLTAREQAPAPVALTVHQQTRKLEIQFEDGAHFHIPFELMRVYSPSAEVQGHGPGQEVLQTGKRDVGITDLQNGLLEADYIVVEMARKILGETWLEDYVGRANAGGIERVLV